MVRSPESAAAPTAPASNNAAASRWRAQLIAALAGAALLTFFSSWQVAVAVTLLTVASYRIALRLRSVRHRAALDGSARDLALALATALAAGQSIRAAVIASCSTVEGPIEEYLRKAARELQLGGELDVVLTTFANDTQSSRISMLIGALNLQRRSGGDLAGLLYELAAAFRQRDHSQRDARTATAQARMTAWIVIAVPLAVALMAELFHHGALTGVFVVAPATILLVVSLSLYVSGALWVWRLARVV
ncbi:MAG: type II secretion system F family protein [Thermoleophilaceae bacterium]|nr:type II secretion system F family protein [Thermoleophilaceae bacterium]